ncbi:hypothetical protein BGLA2_1670004 [Burkholderia gladioli]|nr:hypothetical protein BGLA2_1670004 [Burkholderia gladioli]
MYAAGPHRWLPPAASIRECPPVPAPLVGRPARLACAPIDGSARAAETWHDGGCPPPRTCHAAPAPACRRARNPLQMLWRPEPPVRRDRFLGGRCRPDRRAQARSLRGRADLLPRLRALPLHLHARLRRLEPGGFRRARLQRRLSTPGSRLSRRPGPRQRRADRQPLPGDGRPGEPRFRLRARPARARTGRARLRAGGVLRSLCGRNAGRAGAGQLPERARLRGVRASSRAACADRDAAVLSRRRRRDPAEHLAGSGRADRRRDRHVVVLHAAQRAYLAVFGHRARHAGRVARAEGGVVRRGAAFALSRGAAELGGALLRGGARELSGSAALAHRRRFRKVRALA